MRTLRIKYAIRILCAVLILFINQRFCNGQNLDVIIDSLMNFMHNKYYFDGVVLASENDNIIYEKSFGYANREWQISNTPDTKFRLGSISKQFTAYLIIKLLENKVLDLDAPIGKYVTIFNTIDKEPVTIRNLLTHTSGLFDYTSMKEFAPQIIYPHDSILGMISSYPLDFKPGSQYEYSNSNFFVLGCIVENVTGRKFEDILNDKILNPAGMTNTGEDKNQTILNNRASPYARNESGFINSGYIEMENTMGGGGLYSTAGDLLKWSLFFQKELRNDRYLQSLIQPFKLSNGSFTHYSCGWYLSDVLLHQGHINGFANQLLIDTIHHNTIIILSNNSFRQLFITAKTISDMMLGKKDVSGWLNQKIPGSRLREFEGTYIHNKDTVEFISDGESIISYYQNHKATWKHFTDDEFFREDFEGNIFFERNKNSEIIGIRSLEDYDFVEYKKLSK